MDRNRRSRGPRTPPRPGHPGRPRTRAPTHRSANGVAAETAPARAPSGRKTEARQTAGGHHGTGGRAGRQQYGGRSRQHDEHRQRTPRQHEDGVASAGRLRSDADAPGRRRYGGAQGGAAGRRRRRARPARAGAPTQRARARSGTRTAPAKEPRGRGTARDGERTRGAGTPARGPAGTAATASTSPAPAGRHRAAGNERRHGGARRRTPRKRRGCRHRNSRSGVGELRGTEPGRPGAGARRQHLQHVRDSPTTAGAVRADRAVRGRPA